MLHLSPYDFWPFAALMADWLKENHFQWRGDTADRVYRAMGCTALYTDHLDCTGVFYTVIRCTGLYWVSFGCTELNWATQCCNKFYWVAID